MLLETAWCSALRFIFVSAKTGDRRARKTLAYERPNGGGAKIITKVLLIEIHR